MSSNKKKDKSGLWEFLTQNCRSPTAFEVMMSLAKADIALKRSREFNQKLNQSQKETLKIIELDMELQKAKPNSIQYKRIKRQLQDILKL
jgi:hypothetical protein